MRQDHAQNAMTEIALALAMAFFSIMVLAMVSMGTQAHDASSANAAADLEQGANKHAFYQFLLTPPAASDPAHALADQSQMLDDQILLIIAHQGVFYDSELKTLDSGTLAAMINARGASKQRIMLAISPSLSMQDALNLQENFKGSKVELTLLNDEWMTSLQRIDQ